MSDIPQRPSIMVESPVCSLCKRQHARQTKLLRASLTGLNADKQASGYFCQTMELWVFRSNEIYSSSSGVVTFREDEVTDGS